MLPNVSGNRYKGVKIKLSTLTLLQANNLMHGMGSISREAVETLMSRGLKKVRSDPDLYTWTADFRLRIPSPFKVGQDQVEHFAEQVTCPLMIIKV